MDRSFLVRALGFPATLLHGDTLVLDRWLWLRRRLPVTRSAERLLDVGCGSGAFTIGAALRGYHAVGLSFDAGNQAVACERAKICGAGHVDFPLQDVRQLEKLQDFVGQYDFALCLETMEHILDDRKLMRDIARCLKPGGRLLFSAPNFYYRAISSADNGPFERTESGRHVRRGYSPAMLQELCRDAGLEIEEISSCSGLLSQKVTALWRAIRGPRALRFALTLPLRALPPILDALIAKVSAWPDYSICMVAYKPRWS